MAPRSGDGGVFPTSRHYPSVSPFGRSTSPFVLRKNGEGLVKAKAIARWRGRDTLRQAQGERAGKKRTGWPALGFAREAARAWPCASSLRTAARIARELAARPFERGGDGAGSHSCRQQPWGHTPRFCPWRSPRAPRSGGLRTLPLCEAPAIGGSGRAKRLIAPAPVACRVDARRGGGV